MQAEWRDQNEPFWQITSPCDITLLCGGCRTYGGYFKSPCKSGSMDHVTVTLFLSYRIEKRILYVMVQFGNSSTLPYDQPASESPRSNSFIYAG